MFDNFKKMAELKKLQDEFKKEKLTVEKNGINVKMNGSFEIEDIKLNPALSVEEQERYVKEALNEVREKIQKNLAHKMMSSGINF